MTLVKLTFSLAAVSAGQHGQRDAARPAGPGGQRHAEQRAERVAPGVAEHDLLAQVARQQRGAAPERPAPAAAAPTASGAPISARP
jgi:hypothetical protein